MPMRSTGLAVEAVISGQNKTALPASDTDSPAQIRDDRGSRKTAQNSSAMMIGSTMEITVPRPAATRAKPWIVNQLEPKHAGGREDQAWPVLARDAPLTGDQQSRHGHEHQYNVAQRQGIFRRERQRCRPHEDGRCAPEEHGQEQSQHSPGLLCLQARAGSPRVHLPLTSLPATAGGATLSHSPACRNWRSPAPVPMAP